MLCEGCFEFVWRHGSECYVRGVGGRQGVNRVGNVWKWRFVVSIRGKFVTDSGRWSDW